MEKEWHGKMASSVFSSSIQGCFFGLFDFWLSVLGNGFIQFGCCEMKLGFCATKLEKFSTKSHFNFKKLQFRLVKTDYEINLFIENFRQTATENLNFRIRKNQTGISDSNATF